MVLESQESKFQEGKYRKHSLKSGGTGDQESYTNDFDSIDLLNLEQYGPPQPRNSNTFLMHNDSIFE